MSRPLVNTNARVLSSVTYLLEKLNRRRQVEVIVELP